MPKSSGSVALPTGTVTFLFSDIEGSTQRWEQNREAMDAAVKRHDALMQSVSQQHNGYVFKTVGDAFCVAFARVSDAVATAIDAQRALKAEDFSAVDGLPIRMALHTGEASERNGDYFGPAVNRVARLLGIGHGGQVLISGTATDLLQGVLPPQSSLRDLGQHRLRDLSRPEQVYQLVASGLPDAFPQLRSLDVLPNNLPRQATSFIGRDEVLAEIKALLGKSQLVTIVGTGGVGKTRAALQIGADLLDGSGDGVWFVDFAPLAGAEYVVPEIALVLNVQPQQERSLLDQVRLYLKNKRLLLILDNCEHVVDEASRVVAAILNDCAQVKVLATSREGLNTRGEQAYRMPSLSLPSLEEHPNAEEALRYGAVALFVERASAADARFSFTDDKAAIVTDICRHLDGIALAIELAASRVTILSVKQLSQRLDERFRLLTGGDRAALPRQQTMRAAIEWSYELLSEAEKTLFRCLSIFRGGWTLEASAAVCSDETLDEFSMLEKLSSLASKSLVVVEIAAESQRYRLLESLRQYGLEWLKQRGEFDALARRHAEYFAQRGQLLNDMWSTVPELVWLGQVDAELDNIRAALEWSLTQRNNALLGAALAENLWPFWMSRSGKEGKRWLETAQFAIDPVAQPALNLALSLAMTRMITILEARRDVLPATERALTAARAFGDERMLARATFYHGEALVYLNRLDEAETLLNEALELARRLGDRYRTASTLQELGELNRRRGKLDCARKLMLEAFQWCDATLVWRNGAVALLEFSYLEKLEGNLSRAVELAHEARKICGQLKDRTVSPIADKDLALYLIELDRLDEARLHARSALQVSYDEGLISVTPLAIETLAGLAIRQGGFERGARLMGYAQAALIQLGRDPDALERRDMEWLTQPLRDHFGPDTLEKLAAEGAAWSEDRAVEEALKL
ncbi:MAG: tetratricopeptide repeat protein [Candidatus Eremiobacteraeota bacterium]|nr:tetratricopeptide repeat protein [Candidatus Eremiobacteraeota bacterium]